ncbi:23676_t:CDS:1, partial [Gigaspora margarita]
RLFKEEDKTKMLVTNSALVFKETKVYYKNQIRTKNPQELEEESIWSQVYKLIKGIQDNWFQNIITEITEEK